MLACVDASRAIASAIGFVAVNGCEGCALWGACALHGPANVGELLHARRISRARRSPATHALDVAMHVEKKKRKRRPKTGPRVDARQLGFAFEGYDPRQRRLFT
jgi:hypothetical protein